MMRNDFAVFILSHGRANRCETLKALKKSGYDGKWYIVIDNEDEQGEQYVANYGAEHIKVFNKDDYIDRFDAFDNFRSKAAVIFARHASQDMAREMGLKYYAQMDDDTTAFQVRYAEDRKLRGKAVTNLSLYIDSVIEFLNVSGFYALCLGM